MDMKELLERSGESPTSIAFKMGIVEQTVRNWSTGRHRPKLYVDQVPKLLELLNCDLETLVKAVEETQAKREKIESGKATQLALDAVEAEAEPKKTTRRKKAK